LCLPLLCPKGMAHEGHGEAEGGRHGGLLRRRDLVQRPPREAAPGQMGVDGRHAEGEGRGAEAPLCGGQEPAQMRHDGGVAGSGLFGRGSHGRSRL
jgi:hypothetical protein